MSIADNTHSPFLKTGIHAVKFTRFVGLAFWLYSFYLAGCSSTPSVQRTPEQNKLLIPPPMSSSTRTIHALEVYISNHAQQHIVLVDQSEDQPIWNTSKS
jgi:uncharacterized protein YcfL